MDEPPKRDVEMKTRPCGGTGPRSATPAVFTPGQKITVKWHETVVHPGFFRIAVSMDGAAFPADPTDPPPAVAAPVYAIIPKVAGTTQYSGDITLPTTPCETCTIQVIQYMREHSPPPYYYQCADIAIRAAGASGSGGATGSGGANTGGVSNAGGAATASGGVANATDDAGVSATSRDDGGCSTAPQHHARRYPAALLGALVAAGLASTRRRRSRSG
jgi:MYXO-CTERM domain-containing protein